MSTGMSTGRWTGIWLASIVLALSSGEWASAATTVELTTNGGFETGDFTGWSQFPTAPGQQTISSLNPSSGIFAGQINNSTGGSNSLFKQANLGIGVVMPGQSVNISFDARGSFTPGSISFAEFFSELDGGGVSSAIILGGGPLAMNPDPNVWTTFQFTTITGPDVGGGVTLQLGATNGATASPNANVFYDNVSVTVESTAIPEPSAGALLAGGGLVVWLRRRRRPARRPLV